MTALDAVRLGAVLLGGLSFGAALPVARLTLQRATRGEALSIRLFLVVHLSIVLYVAGVLASDAGEPVGWQAPAAIFIFTLKLAVLLLLREVGLQRECQEQPPQRRAEDQPA